MIARLCIVSPSGLPSLQGVSARTIRSLVRDFGGTPLRATGYGQYAGVIVKAKFHNANERRRFSRAATSMALDVSSVRR